MKSILTIIILLYLITPNCFSQNKTYSVCISKDEMKLYELIMKYRKEKGQPEIPLSKALTFVARTHAKDIDENQAGEGCNMHSWSDKGKWTACCYTSDHKQAQCMWDKPKELTNYTGDGFEIAHGGQGNYVATPEKALEGWKSSKGHNPVIINEGKWADNPWKAIGIGMYNGYSVVWFGMEADAEGKPDTCK
jgi:hypothetical protein